MHRAPPGGIGSADQCLVPCIATTKYELLDLGTRCLRPESAAHRVLNSTKKRKCQVNVKFLFHKNQSSIVANPVKNFPILNLPNMQLALLDHHPPQ